MMGDRKKSQDKIILSEIQSLSESIKKKHRALKRDIADTTSTLEKTFQPLSEPLKTLTKQLSDKRDNEQIPLLREKKEEVVDDITPKRNEKRLSDRTIRFLEKLPDTSQNSTPRFQRTYTVAETPPPPPASVNTILATPEGRREGVSIINTLPYGTLAKEYLQRMITDTENTIDNTYGPRMLNDTIMVGDGEVKFDKNDLYIKGTRYTGTQGLYELIFMKRPDEEYYNDNDLKAYKSILIATNAHRQRYRPDKQINSNQGYKYRNVIRKLFGAKVGGDSSMYLPTNKMHTYGDIDYVHWNDINELVDRLRLLVSSKRAGHSAHDNEIISILEELREAKVIA